MQANLYDLLSPVMELRNFLYFKKKEEHSPYVHFGKSDNTQEKEQVINYEGYLLKKQSLLLKCLESNKRQVKLNHETGVLYS